RSQPLTFLQLFDQPVIETNCTRRETSTVASQALTLLNSDFMTRNAAAFADRVLKEQPANPAERALLLAFGRPPTDKESTLFAAYFTTLPPDTKNLAIRLGIPRTKTEYVFAFVAANDLTPVDSDRGEFIFYSPSDYLVAEDRQQFQGKRDDV